MGERFATPAELTTTRHLTLKGSNCDPEFLSKVVYGKALGGDSVSVHLYSVFEFDALS